jgi:hypothetical protein
MEIEGVFCETGTKFLNIIQMGFVFQRIHVNIYVCFLHFPETDVF